MNEEPQKNEKINAHIFVCTDKTEPECLQRMLFGSNKLYADDVLAVKRGDLLFLLNVNSNVLHGIFRAKSEGRKNIVPDAWRGRYPYQVEVEPVGKIQTIEKAKDTLKKLGIPWHKPLDSSMTQRLLTIFPSQTLEHFKQENTEWGLLAPQKVSQKNSSLKSETLAKFEDEKPLLEATTLWDYPRQSYGKTPKGDNKYPGVTPAFVIWNLIQRYTEPGDLVLDPMAGSGTTLDVCKEENRRVICYDISPTRPDIIQNDSRTIPLPDNYVDMIFVDSPYGDNIRYNEHPDCIGKISSETETFYDELEKVMKECYRVLKPGKVIGWLIGDQWVKKKFTPVGFKVYQRLSKYFETVDIVCVVRRGQASHTAIWYNRARRFNFFLRGFKYLFIMRKPSGETTQPEPRTVKWAYYDRNRGKANSS
ncbi:MAG: DNA methyltransferase [Candidatus Bathyarchaeia archaeon]